MVDSNVVVTQGLSDPGEPAIWDPGAFSGIVHYQGGQSSPELVVAN